MRPIFLALATLMLLTFLPSPAAAQQTGAVTVILQPPEDVLTEDARSLTFTGTVTLVADYTALLGLSGVPVTYTVTKQPEWATVVVSPATDVFTIPTTPGLSPSFQSTRTITVTVTLAETPAADASGEVEIAATTSPAFFGKAFTGKGSTPIVYDAPEEPCPEHALTEEQLAALAVEAADAYNEHQASRSGDAEEVSVQTGGASTVPLPWMVVGGFALVGAGVGLVLRRRLGA